MVLLLLFCILLIICEINTLRKLIGYTFIFNIFCPKLRLNEIYLFFNFSLLFGKLKILLFHLFNFFFINSCLFLNFCLLFVYLFVFDWRFINFVLQLTTINLKIAYFSVHWFMKRMTPCILHPYFILLILPIIISLTNFS